MERVGVIGCRGIGVRHASGIAGLEGADVVAACDLSTDQLDEFEERWQATWPELKRYTSHREMLEKESLDIVTVATSDHAHAQLVVDAAEAGVKGVFCEKPLATTVEDAARMVAACEASGTVLSVDHTRRFTPMWAHAKELIDAGEIGEVQYIVGSLRGQRAMLFRNGTHSIDAICWYAAGDPAWVMADLETGYEDYTEYRGDGGHDPATEPGAYGMIRFANGVRAFYAGGSKTTPGPKSTTEIIGSSGRILLWGTDTGQLIRGEEAEPFPVPEWSVSGIEAGAQDLVRAVRENRAPGSTGREAQRVVEVITGFLQSQQQGNAPVHIPAAR
jgi:predicted dehydrogenase